MTHRKVPNLLANSLKTAAQGQESGVRETVTLSSRAIRGPARQLLVTQNLDRGSKRTQATL